METLIIKPEGVCSREITVVYENGIILKATPVGGCQGNLTAVCKLIEGRKISEIIPIIDGIKCRGSRNGQTSCPDQLAQGLKKILN